MTRINLILSAALAVLMLTSGCDALIDVEPRQSIDADRAISSSQGVQTALIGAYDGMTTANLWGGRALLMPDLLADAGDLDWSGTFIQPREFYLKTILPNNAFSTLQWTSAYNAMNTANNVLASSHFVENEAQRRRIEGEARFIRGMLLHHLVRLYGRPYMDGDPQANLGVPIILEPTTVLGDDSRVARNTVAEVYAQAEADLVFARDVLPETNGFFATTYAASAYLSRLYSDQHRWALAAAEAGRVIDSGRFDLVDDYAGAFNQTQNPDEYVFAIQITSQDGVNSLNEFYGTAPGRSDISITDQHLDRYEEGDERLDLFYVASGDVWTGKWRTGASAGTNIPLVRLAEMYLTRAEANLRGGTQVGATPEADLNMVRGRVGLEPVNEATLQNVLDERRLELAFEGHWLHDVRRNQGSVGNIPWNHNRLVYPIPQREMDANSALVQNPGYAGA
jgi:starch-binding outer membrane protein, SusD/RagB family